MFLFVKAFILLLFHAILA